MTTSRRRSLVAGAAVAAVVGALALPALGNPPPPRQQDPISLDPFSPSVLGFGNTWSDLYGDNPVPPGMGWDVGGPGPVLHVISPAYGVLPIPDNTDAISNGEFRPNLQQVIYFSVDDLSMGRPGTPIRHQALRGQHAGDRWVTNGRTSSAPAVGPFPAVIVGGFGGPRHILSANQTAYNEIPSIPPAVFNFFAPPAGASKMDDMDALELNPIDLNNNKIHDTFIWFSLAAGSPTLGAIGATPADILVAPPGAPVVPVPFAPCFAMGLTPADDIDGLAVWNAASPFVADPGLDVAIFSLAPGSPYLAGPDGVAGTADDYSAADVFVTRFMGASTLYVSYAQLGLLFSDNVDALDVEAFLRPQVFGWWVQRFNIDIVFRPPPGWPGTPANDLHVIIPGVTKEQVLDLWTGSFPNVEVEESSAGVRLNWSGAEFLPLQVAHIGWTLSDTTTLASQQIQIYWTRDGQPLPPFVPDNVQRWVWETPQGVVDRLPNFSPEPVLVQRRIAQLDKPVSMDDLMIGTPLWEGAQLIDPQPVPVMPDSFFDVFFDVTPQTQTYSVMYDVLNTSGQRLATHLNALTMIQTPELEQEGACCFGDTCQIVSEEFCTQWEGRFHGIGTRCEDVQCAPIACPGDVNCDGIVNFKDIDPFVSRLGCPGSDPVGCNTPSGCTWQNADVNGDGQVTFKDIDPFVGTLGNVCDGSTR